MLEIVQGWAVVSIRKVRGPPYGCVSQSPLMLLHGIEAEGVLHLGGLCTLEDY